MEQFGLTAREESAVAQREADRSHRPHRLRRDRSAHGDHDEKQG
jgi:hypothetical protein